MKTLVVLLFAISASGYNFIVSNVFADSAITTDGVQIVQVLNEFPCKLGKNTIYKQPMPSNGQGLRATQLKLGATVDSQSGEAGSYAYYLDLDITFVDANGVEQHWRDCCDVTTVDWSLLGAYPGPPNLKGRRSGGIPARSAAAA